MLHLPALAAWDPEGLVLSTDRRGESGSWERILDGLPHLSGIYSTCNTYHLGKEEMPTFSCYFVKECLAAGSYKFFCHGSVAKCIGTSQPESSLPWGQNLPLLWRLLQAQRTPSNGDSLAEEISHAAKTKYCCL